jgi:2-iminoacetate synthase
MEGSMTFSRTFDSLPLARWHEGALTATPSEVAQAVAGRSGGDEILRFARLIGPEAGRPGALEAMCQASRRLTQQRFGKVMRFFAPLYLSNECVNNCKYCGFSRDNAILRVTLSVEEVVREARALRDRGFRHLLLVSGEHPRFAGNPYIARCVEALRAEVPSLSLEVGPMETEDYREMVAAGAEALVVYQETYDRGAYAEVHTAGPKKDFDWRLDTPERGYAAGFRRLGIGALHGLSDWRFEALALAAHLAHLQRRCWKAQLTVSLPRLRPHAGEYLPPTRLEDRELAQLVAAYRLVFPDLGIVLSTREPASLRDGLIPLGVTHLSAGSHTEPGGYTGAGADKLHRTRRGRIEDLEAGEAAGRGATGQFEIADERSPEQMAQVVRRLGYEPVWKDWDTALSGER